MEWEIGQRGMFVFIRKMSGNALLSEQLSTEPPSVYKLQLQCNLAALIIWNYGNKYYGRKKKNKLI